MRYLSFLFFFIPYLNVNAQTELLKKNSGLKEILYSPIKPIVIENEDKNIKCILINDETAIKGYMFDNNMKLTKEFLCGGIAEGDKILSGFFKGDEAIIFTYRREGKGLKCITYNLTEKFYDSRDLVLDSKNYDFVGHFNRPDEVLYMAVNRKENIFRIFILGENHTNSYSYNLNTSAYKNLIQNTQSSYLLNHLLTIRSFDITTIKSDTDLDTKSASAPNKLYLRNDSLLLTIDKVRGETLVFSMLLNDTTINMNTITTKLLPVPRNLLDNPSFNSYLLDDNFFYIDATVDSLSITSSNYLTGELRNRFNAKASQDIIFKNTAILQESDRVFAASRTLDNTSQLLNKMVRGKSLISAYSYADDKYLLTVGGFKESSRSPMVSSGGAMMGGGSTAERMAYFKMLINKSDAKHIADNISTSAPTKLDSFLKDSVLEKESYTIFKSNKKLYLAYYNSENTEIKVLEFGDK